MKPIEKLELGGREMNRYIADFITKIRQSLADFCETKMHKSKSIKWEIFWGHLGHKLLGLK